MDLSWKYQVFHWFFHEFRWRSIGFLGWFESEARLERLLLKASDLADFVFVDGPVELPLQHEERINTSLGMDVKGLLNTVRHMKRIARNSIYGSHIGAV